MAKKQFTVTGMTCAACSARVEKAVSAVSGVSSCAVNLLTNSMTVEGTATEKALAHAVCYGMPVKKVETASGWEGIKHFKKAEFACKCGKLEPHLLAAHTILACAEFRRISVYEQQALS